LKKKKQKLALKKKELEDKKAKNRIYNEELLPKINKNLK
jgi:hypothetical protein